jgi:polyhydroxyalkanoate synthase
MDLMPGASLVEYLVEEGYDVFMLDWGTPGEEDADLDFDGYVFGYMPRVVKQVVKHSGASHTTLLGYCMGGTISTMYMATHPDAPVKNLVLLTTPVDFADTGLFGRFLDPARFDAAKVTDTLKLVPPEFIDMGSKMTKPMQNYMRPWISIALGYEDEQFARSWAAMNKWVNDGVPFPGAAYRQWVQEFYQQNKLIKGELVLGGQQVDLANISVPLLNVYADKDHICQPCQALPLMDKVSSTDKTTLAIDAGHVGLVASRGARKKFFPKLDAWLSVRSHAN